MKARVIVYDDNDNPVGSYYELVPSRICEYGLFTKYVFGFEYNEFRFRKGSEELNKLIRAENKHDCRSE